MSSREVETGFNKEWALHGNSNYKHAPISKQCKVHPYYEYDGKCDCCGGNYCSQCLNFIGDDYKLKYCWDCSFKNRNDPRVHLPKWN
jgi:hypothetical protein